MPDIRWIQRSYEGLRLDRIVRARISPEMKAQLRRVARAEHRPVSSIVRTAVHEHLRGERNAVAAPRCVVCGGPFADGSGCEFCPRGELS